MRIAFAGSHGVGKSTLARWLAKELEYTLIPDIARELRILGLYPDRNEKKVEHYAYVLWKQQRLESRNELFVADSALYTTLVYAVYDTIVEEHLEWMVMKYADYDRLFYISAELPPEKDAMRGEDKKYQHEVDELYRHFLDDNRIKYVEISGDLQKRKNKIMNYIPK